jgi:hypothetical protein
MLPMTILRPLSTNCHLPVKYPVNTSKQAHTLTITTIGSSNHHISPPLSLLLFLTILNHQLRITNKLNHPLNQPPWNIPTNRSRSHPNHQLKQPLTL